MILKTIKSEAECRAIFKKNFPLLDYNCTYDKDFMALIYGNKVEYLGKDTDKRAGYSDETRCIIKFNNKTHLIYIKFFK